MKYKVMKINEEFSPYFFLEQVLKSSVSCFRTFCKSGRVITPFSASRGQQYSDSVPPYSANLIVTGSRASRNLKLDLLKLIKISVKNTKVSKYVQFTNQLLSQSKDISWQLISTYISSSNKLNYNDKNIK